MEKKYQILCNLWHVQILLTPSYKNMLLANCNVFLILEVKCQYNIKLNIIWKKQNSSAVTGNLAYYENFAKQRHVIRKIKITHLLSISIFKKLLLRIQIR